VRKFTSVIILCILLISVMTSCYDAREIDEMSYVMAIGIDKGVENKWRISFQIPSFREGSGGDSSKSGGTGENTIIYTVDAPSFAAAVNLANTSISRRLYFLHTKCIIFSKEAAEEGYIGTLAAALVRNREIRRSIRTVVVDGQAQDFLKEANPVVGSELSKYYDTLFHQQRDSGFFPPIRLYETYNGMVGNYMQPIAILGGINNLKNLKKGEEKRDMAPEPKDYSAGEIPRTGGGKAELMGSVIGNGEKMVGELTGFETRIMMMARGNFRRLYFTNPDPSDPDKAVVLEVRERKEPTIKIKFDGNRPTINLKLHLEGDFISIQSRTNYENKDKKRIIEKSVEETIKPQLDSLIKKCQNLNSDVFGFGLYAARSFPTIQDWEKYNWAKHFKEAEVSTEVEFTVVRTGTMIKSSPIIGSEGRE
jgi:spore germination protein KC